jgi:hypothetical protein
MADEDLHPLTILTTMLVPMREPNEWERQLVERDVPVAVLQDKFDHFIKQMRTMAAKATELGRTSWSDGGPAPGNPDNDDQRPEFLLDEITFNAEVSPDGDFKLIGTGGQPSGGGMQFVWRRKHVFGTADLNKTLVSSLPRVNELRTAVVGPKWDDGRPLQIEVSNVVRTTIEDIVHVLLVGI